jgi:hypothetical protein
VPQASTTALGEARRRALSASGIDVGQGPRAQSWRESVAFERAATTSASQPVAVRCNLAPRVSPGRLARCTPAVVVHPSQAPSRSSSFRRSLVFWPVFVVFFPPWFASRVVWCLLFPRSTLGFQGHIICLCTHFRFTLVGVGFHKWRKIYRGNHPGSGGAPGAGVEEIRELGGPHRSSSQPHTQLYFG